LDNGLQELDRGDAATRARALATRVANDVGRADLADDAALVTSELVANAVLHAGGCRGVEVLPVDDGLRIEVCDASAVPPVFGRQSEDALTGRGIRLVAALAARWGVDPQPTGKVVWAEVTGETKSIDPTLTAADLLAMWGDESDDLDDSAAEARYRVQLGDVPTDLLLAAKAHVENVAREFALASAGAEAGMTAAVPSHLTAVLAAFDRFAEARLSIKRQALEAAGRHAPTTRLTLYLPASAADAAERYLEALDEVDAYCRAARLLTLETPPQHRVFRQWYVGQLVAQLRAAAAGEESPPTQSFETRLLAELDVLAAAQRASDRAARLYAVSAALANAETPEAVAGVVLNEGVAALRAAGGGVLLSTDEDRLTLPGAVGYDESVVARLGGESRNDELPAAYALRTGHPVWLESRADRDARFPDLVGIEATTVSLCAVPLEVQGRRLGALRFSFNEARLFGEEERRFVLALAAQTAQALDRSQLQHARIDVSRRLQRSLLPPGLPAIPGLDVAAIYNPFGDGVDVGGDFYDLWEMAGGRWAVAVGDAAGTGPEAAALTAVVRHTLRALTLFLTDPMRVMEALNVALCAAARDDRFCTCIFGVITPGDTVELHLASGGHPPALVRRADGHVDAVHIGGSLLGVFPEVEVATVKVELGAGDTIVLLTDGVLEARREGQQFDLEGVIEVLSADVASADEAVTGIQRAVLAHTGGSLTDDMAAIAVRVGPD
jgi:serine phosphatase RsbU (regulator of sigma subunit)/anti-sigma regulatory factor (Ser/Thr protein kinase)